MLVFVYPEKTREPFGKRRFEVEWQELTQAAQKRYDADPNYEHDRDSDEVNVARHFDTKADAEAFAAAKADSGDTVYGCATVTEQVVDWYVEEDRIAEWADVGEATYFP